MSFEEDVAAYRRLSEQIHALEEQRKALGQKIMGQMTEKKMVFSDCTVHRYMRLSIRMPIEQARSLGATVMVEQIDREKIKELYRLGEPLEGVKEHSYLMVSQKKEDFSSDEM